MFDPRVLDLKLVAHAVRDHRGGLVALALLAGGLWSFIELADAVVEGSTHAYDRAILLALRSEADLTDPLGPGWFEEMMRDFTGLGGVAVLTMLTLASSGFLALAGRPRAALAVLGAIGLGIALSMLLKTGFSRDRPDLVPHGSVVYSTSFPSGHSMMSAIVYLTLASLLGRVVRLRRLRAYLLGVAILVTLLVGASRVYLGVHWPTDVLAGWTLGAFWALLSTIAMLRLQISSAVEPRGVEPVERVDEAR